MSPFCEAALGHALQVSLSLSLSFARPLGALVYKYRSNDLTPKPETIKPSNLNANTLALTSSVDYESFNTFRIWGSLVA